MTVGFRNPEFSTDFTIMTVGFRNPEFSTDFTIGRKVK